MENKKKVIFGLGSGRCGTASLAYLLNDQKDAFIGHEMPPVLPWDTSDLTGLQFRWDQMQHQSHLYSMVGDVGIYYLPYIPILIESHESIPFMRENYVIKFVILQRDRKEVINSFMKKLKRQNNNPFQNIKAPGTNVDEWDECFPKYDGMTLRDAVGTFYDDYYRESERLALERSDIVKIFSVDSLNNEKGVLEILDFVGIDDPRVSVSIRKNES
jgi:hypothetical protein